MRFLRDLDLSAYDTPPSSSSSSDPSPVTAAELLAELRPSRRQVLKGGLAAGLGLVIGFRMGGTAKAAEAAAGSAETVFAPNAFLRIAPDGAVTVIAKHIEFGQGSYTGLATIVADEIGADWSRVSVESAPADASRYGNSALGGAQGTGGSTAMVSSWEPMRKAGATARSMLAAAAAAAWGVPAEEVEIADHKVRHSGSGKEAGLGEMAVAAGELQPPKDAKPKDLAAYRLIGKNKLPRVDVPAKTDGSAVFTLDMKIPGMLTALIARPPRFGATVASFDDSATRKVAGVKEVVQVPAGVAVLADSFWAAKMGRDALEVTWDESKAEKRGSEQLFAEYKELAGKAGKKARGEGDAAATLEGAAKVLEATYEFPYLAHAPMEPMDFLLRLDGDKAEAWAGSQIQTIDQGVVAQTLGIPPQNVTLHTLFGGGSFGRRATPVGDVAGEAASIVKAIGGKAPVKVVWTREDDIQGGRYRPLYVHRLRAGIDDAGKITAWHHHIVGQSILSGTPFAAAMVKDGIDHTSVEGAISIPYKIPNLQVDLTTTDVGVPVLWWRSVGSTHNGYAVETFLDQVARELGRDPVELRRELLADHPRELGVLNLAAEKAGWGGALPEGRARGVAVHKSFDTYVAQVVEVSLDASGVPKVHRVVCAVDCGVAINPDNIRAQMEGGLGFGLGAALHDEVVLEEGRPKQSNFHDYRSLRIGEMPEVEVHIVDSTEKPTGVGEPGLPPLAPAVANAYLQLTGEPIHRLPMRHLAKKKKGRMAAAGRDRATSGEASGKVVRS